MTLPGGKVELRIKAGWLVSLRASSTAQNHQKCPLPGTHLRSPLK